MEKNCAPLLADLFLFLYKRDFLDNLTRTGHKRFARSFNLRCGYIDHLIVANSKKFKDYVEDIYPSELNLKRIIDRMTKLITWTLPSS